MIKKTIVLHMLLMLCRSVLAGAETLFFFLVLAFFLHLWEASDLLEPLLVASELPELGFSASMVLLL